jgi:cell pole-organizing protein PopZ
MGDMNQDQSMEEILASIKRVIAEDGRPAAAPGRARAGRKASTEPGAKGEAFPEPEAAIDEDDVLELSNPLPPDPSLISENVTAATRQSLAALAAVRGPRHFEPESREGPLEAVVREMLRPMLKEWLDTRLPEMVEDMVAREIARITGKRG